MQKETLDRLTKLLAVLGGLWSIVMIIAVGALATQSTWQEWLAVKSCVLEGTCPESFYAQNREFVRYGDEVHVKVGSWYLRGNPDSSAEKEVRMVETPLNSWMISRD